VCVGAHLEALLYRLLAPPQRVPAAYPLNDLQTACVGAQLIAILCLARYQYDPSTCVAQAARCLSEAVPLLAPAGGRHPLGHMISRRTCPVHVHPLSPVPAGHGTL
jgi:hypothetical protein